MANTCLNCKRTLGLFSGENKIHPDSTHFLCDKCYSPFGTAANRIRALQNSDEILMAYCDAKEAVQKSALIEKEQILCELEESYQHRISSIAEAEFDLIQLEKKKEDERKRIEEEKRKSEYINNNYSDISENFLMTTGNGFSNYKITEYLGIVSEGVVQGTGFLSEFSADVNDLFGTESNTFANKMKMCRDSALQKAKDAAIRRGANALVSIDFETTTFRNNMIGTMVAGTAVRIEKMKDTHD